MRRPKLVTWVSSLFLSGCLSSPPGRPVPWSVQQARPVPPGARQPLAPQGASPTLVTPAVPKSPAVPKTFESPIQKSAPPGDKLVPEPIDPLDRPEATKDRIDTQVNKPVELLEPAPTLKLQPSPFNRADDPSLDLGAPKSSSKESFAKPERPSVPLDAAREGASGSKSSSPNAASRFEALSAPSDAPLMMEVTNPKRRPLGSLASFDVLVTNASEQTMENVVVDVTFDDELAFPGRAEKQFRKSLGILRPGQSRDLRLSLRGDRAGTPACRFEVSADGMSPIQRESRVEFAEPKLLMKLVGPSNRTVGGCAEFTVRIANISSQPMNDVQVTLRHDGAFTPREATTGYHLDAADRDKHQLRWSLGQLAPGAGVQVQADFDCKQLAEQACVSAQVKCDDLLVEEADRCVTVVSNPGDLELDLSDQAEPTRVGGEVTFDVRVKNRAFDPLADLRLDLVPSEHLRLVAVEATLNDKPVAFTESKSNGIWRLTVTDSLPPDELLHLVVRAKGIEPGDADLKVIATSDAESKPIESSEFTVINP